MKPALEYKVCPEISPADTLDPQGSRQREPPMRALIGCIPSGVVKLLIWPLVLVSMLVNAELAFVSPFYQPGDLDAFLSSARAAVGGRNPYAEMTSMNIPLYNRNPPIGVLVFVPLAKFSLEQVTPFMRAISMILCAVCIGLLYTAYRPKTPFIHVAALLATAGHWVVYSTGQIYIFLAIAIVLAWIFVDRKRYALAGIFIGLVVALKPSFIIWPILLFFAGYRRMSLSTFLSAGLFTVLPAPILGLQVYYQWIKLNTGVEVLDGTKLPENMSAFGVGARLNLPWLGYAVIALLLVAVLIWLHKARPSAETVSKVAIVSSVLASPFGWIMYLVLFLPLYFIQKWSPFHMVAAALFIVPAAILRFLGLISVATLNAVGLVYFVGCILLLWSVISTTPRTTGNDSLVSQ